MEDIPGSAWLLFATQAIIFLTSLVGMWLTLRGHKTVNELSIRVDGRLTQLIESIKVAEFASGKTAGVEEQKEVQNEPPTQKRFD